MTRSYTLKLLSIFIFVMLLALPLLAQKKGWQDVVYLHNGSIIRGNLVEESSGGVVKIKIMGGSVFVFPEADVARVTREYSKSNFVYPYQAGYLNITELGISLGYRPMVTQFDPNTRITGFSFQTFNGYQFYPLFALGLTTGLDTYAVNTLLPVGIGIRGDLAKSKVRPYYGLDAGYALDWLNNPNLPGNYKGGFFWSPTLGFKFNSAKSHAFIINMGYRSQRATTTSEISPTFIRTDQQHYKRMLFRVGLSF